jgi:hypothetical protein
MVPQLGPRDFNWRADAPASIYYTVAQDNGDPKVKADIRDKVFLTEAPIPAQPKGNLCRSVSL